MKSKIFILLIFMLTSFCKHSENRNDLQRSITKHMVTDNSEEFVMCTSAMEKPELMAINMIQGGRMTQETRQLEDAFTRVSTNHAILPDKASFTTTLSDHI